jgi:hypothetical protein
MLLVAEDSIMKAPLCPATPPIDAQAASQALLIATLHISSDPLVEANQLFSVGLTRRHGAKNDLHEFYLFLQAELTAKRKSSNN